MIDYIHKKHLREERIYFVLLYQRDRVHHGSEDMSIGRKGMEAEAGSWYSNYTQGAERGQGGERREERTKCEP